MRAISTSCELLDWLAKILQCRSCCEFFTALAAASLCDAPKWTEKWNCWKSCPGADDAIANILAVSERQSYKKLMRQRSVVSVAWHLTTINSCRLLLYNLTYCDVGFSRDKCWDLRAWRRRRDAFRHKLSSHLNQWWKQDQNVKTKTKTEAGLRPVLS